MKYSKEFKLEYIMKYKNGEHIKDPPGVKHRNFYDQLRNKRDFSTTGPNQKWKTDVSMFKIPEGKLYLSPIMDMYDGSIISYDISTNPNFEQTKRMIDTIS